MFDPFVFLLNPRFVFFFFPGFGDSPFVLFQGLFALFFSDFVT